MSSTTESSPGDGTNENDLPIHDYVEALTSHDRGIQRFLDMLVSRKLVGEQEVVRKAIRKFGQQNTPLFKAVVFLLSEMKIPENDDFEGSIPKDTRKKLMELAESYSSLREEFKIVSSEFHFEAKNPWPTIRTEPSYDVDTGLPLMDCKLTSSDVPIDEFRAPPSHVLSMAATVIGHAGFVYRDLDDEDRELHLKELENTKDALQNVRSSLEDTMELVQSVDESSASEDEGGHMTDSSEYYFH